MRLHDKLAGLLSVLVGVVVGVCAWGFPPAPGPGIGPGGFPLLVGGGFVACGLGLIRLGCRQRGAAWLAPEDWLRQPRLVGRAALVIGAVAGYALVVDTAGFFLTALVFLGGLFAAFGVARRWIMPIAAGVTLALHVVFYSLLRVPLPWGWLEGIGW